MGAFIVLYLLHYIVFVYCILFSSSRYYKIMKNTEQTNTLY